MHDKKSFYVTTAIAYANAKPHIGFGLELLYADVVARYQRGRGREVRFLTGTDEHGQKIVQKAIEAGKEPKAFVDEMSQHFRDLAKKLAISNTDFIRTTEARHFPAAQEMWRRVNKAGYIYKKKYGGLYCVGCEAFKTEKELVDGLCMDHRTKPSYIEEENYFFKLSAFKGKLQDLYAARPDFVVPEHKFNEVKQLVDELDESFDVSISRSRKQLTWGIPVPDDEEQVMYVWFDALVNYLTGAGFPDDADAMETFWPCDVHVIGKEINRFHTMLWPAMLMAAGVELPKQVAVHGWINVDGQKMSKSLGNVIDPEDLISTYGVDATRYLLLAQAPFMNDGDWNHERSRQKYTADLANDLGNLVHRVTSMTMKYCKGKKPAADASTYMPAEVPVDQYREHMEHYRFDQALHLVFAGVQGLNQSIDANKPWTLAKEGKQKDLEGLLGLWLERIRDLAELLRPFMPETAERIVERVGGDMVTVGEPLFPRLEAPAA